MWRTLLFFSFLLLVAGCDSSSDDGDDSKVLTFTFEEGTEDWIGDFADYPMDWPEEQLELKFERRQMPEGLNGGNQGMYLSGLNHSDDLFMYLKRRVAGLLPNTLYSATFDVKIGSASPTGCSGIGGAPGEAVRLKVGLSSVEPQTVIEETDYRLNLNKDDEGADSFSSIVDIGDVANGVEQCDENVPFRLINRNNAGQSIAATTNSNGELWLIIGTDSGSEGRTELYYDQIDVELKQEPAIDTFYQGG